MTAAVKPKITAIADAPAGGIAEEVAFILVSSATGIAFFYYPIDHDFVIPLGLFWHSIITIVRLCNYIRRLLSLVLIVVLEGVFCCLQGGLVLFLIVFFDSLATIFCPEARCWERCGSSIAFKRFMIKL